MKLKDGVHQHVDGDPRHDHVQGRLGQAGKVPLGGQQYGGHGGDLPDISAQPVAPVEEPPVGGVRVGSK